MTATAEVNANASVAAGISIDPKVPALKIVRAAPSRARRRTSNVVTVDDGNPQLDDSFMDRFRKWSAIAGSASRKERRVG